MIVWPTTQRPMEFTVRFFDRQIIDTSIATLHQAILVKFPVFIAIRTKPLAIVIVPLVGESDRDSVAFISPEFFY